MTAQFLDAMRAANLRGGRFVRFGGLRFPMLYGFWAYVTDPETGEILVSTGGGGL